MENRINLNKKIKYELPDEIVVGEYFRFRDREKIPTFNPDICLTSYGSIKVSNAKEACHQIWIKTDNKDLINFIEGFDFEKELFRITNTYACYIYGSLKKLF